MFEKVRRTILKINEQREKHFKGQDDQLLHTICKYSARYRILQQEFTDQGKVVEDYHKTKKINYSNLMSLREAFDTSFWPLISTELQLQKLLSEIEQSEREIKETVRLNKAQGSKISGTSSNTDERLHPKQKLKPSDLDLSPHKKAEEEGAKLTQVMNPVEPQLPQLQ